MSIHSRTLLSQPRTVKRPGTLAVGNLLANSILTVLIVIPILSYFDDVVLFTATGIDINVRLILLITALSSAIIVVIFSRSSRVPRLFTFFLLFTLWGTVIAIIQFVPIRWWLPPFLRWTANVFMALAAYHLVLGGYLTTQKFHKGILLALIIPLAGGVVQAAFGLAPLLNGAFRISSTIGRSPLGFALFLTGLGCLLLSRRTLNIYTVFFLTLSFGMTIMTHSRLVIVAFVISIGWILLTQRRYSILITLGLFAISLLILFPTMTLQLMGRFSAIQTIDYSVLRRAADNATQYMWSERGLDNSVLLRLQTHVIGWEAFTQSPVYGNGLGSYVPIYEQATGRPNVAAHNDYLLYLVETGIIGLCAYLFLQLNLVWFLLWGFRKYDTETRFFTRGVAGSYIAINVFSFLSNSYYFFEVQLWIWLGIGLAFGLFRLGLPNIRNQGDLTDVAVRQAPRL